MSGHLPRPPAHPTLPSCDLHQPPEAPLGLSGCCDWDEAYFRPQCREAGAVTLHPVTHLMLPKMSRTHKQTKAQGCDATLLGPHR